MRCKTWRTINICLCGCESRVHHIDTVDPQTFDSNIFHWRKHWNCCFSVVSLLVLQFSGAEWTAPVKLNSLHLLICSNIHRRCCRSGSLCKIFSSNADYRRVVLLRLLRPSLCDGWTAFRVISARVKRALISLTSVLFAVRGGVSRSGMSFTKMLMQRKVGVTMRSSGNDTGRSHVDSE